MEQELETIIELLRVRTGSYGEDRNNLVNNLFKSIIDLSFPNVVKYLFWACDSESGIFEKIDPKEYTKWKTMSKYKKDEMQTGNNDKSMSSDDGEKPKEQTINQMLNISLEQNELLIKEAHKIK